VCMASPPFEVEDQTDEDFFDRLVNDEIDCTGSGASAVQNDVVDEAKALSNLSIAEVDATGADSGGNVGLGVVDGEMGLNDLVASASFDASEDTMFGKESDSLTPGNAKEYDSVVDKVSMSSLPGNTNEGSEVGIGEEGALDSAVGKNSEPSGMGMKVVQWSSFGSEVDAGSGGFGSYSDFFSEMGDNSGDPFTSVANMGKLGTESNVVDAVLENPVADLGASSYGQHQESQFYGVGTGEHVNSEDLSNSQYLENLYPGWKYDVNTGQWYQLAGNDASANTTANIDTNANANARAVSDEVLSDHAVGAFYQQQIGQAQSVVGTVAEGYTSNTTGSVSHQSQLSQGTMQYPAHMVFDPQYPGWYYDTITNEWKLLESDIPTSNRLKSVDTNQQYLSQNVENHGSQSLVSQEHAANWDGSESTYNQQSLNMWQTQNVAKNDAIGFNGNKKLGNHYSSVGHLTDSVNQQSRFNSVGSLVQYEQSNQSVDGSSKVLGFQSFIPNDHFPQHQSQAKKELNQLMHFIPAHLDSQKPVIFSQQPLQSGTQFSYAPTEERSSAGRPPHALVTFGFGGKLIVMKDNSSFSTNSYGSQVRALSSSGFSFRFIYYFFSCFIST
jgi:hypothetical protein